MIDIKNLSFSYGREQIIKELTFKIKENGIYAIMGPSGCGKSTFFCLIAGLLKQSSGSIDISSHKLGFCFQEPRLLPWSSAEENVNFVLGGKKTSLDKAKAVLCDLGLGDSLKKFPSELSGGMQKRVALARALVTEPDLILLDEPFSGLDEETKEEVMKKVEAYSEKAIILWITHDPSEAERYAKAVYSFSELNKKG